MNILKMRKKPVIIEAVLLEANTNSIANAIEFLGDKYVAQPLEEVHVQGHLKLKTPESHGQTQNADFGDYILKGYTEKLGTHFWPVKPDYVEENYQVVEEHTIQRH